MLQYIENEKNNSNEMRSSKHAIIAARIRVAPDLARICFVYTKYNRSILW